MTKKLENKTPEARFRAGRQVWRKLENDHRVSLADVRRLRYFGQVSKSLLPLATQAEREQGELLADKGDSATVAERVILQDVARLGLLLRAEFAIYLKTQDPKAAMRVNALAGQRRASLVAVGLERRAQPVTVEGVVAEIEAGKGE